MKLGRLLIIVQGTYTFITAAWPLIDITSFMAVTGYKTDVWLVKTVGALLIPVALTLFSPLVLKTDRRPAGILGATTAIAFATIDIYYAGTDVISDIYLVDAVVQIIFLLLWGYLVFGNKLTDNNH